MKNYFVILFISVGILCKAQNTINFEHLLDNFKLNRPQPMFVVYDGKFVSSKDSAEYIVQSYNGYTQKEIYHSLLIALNDKCDNFDKMSSKIENEAISVNGYFKDEEHLVFSTKISSKIEYYIREGFYYRLSFKMKDGKLRIDAPSVSDVVYTDMDGKNRTKNSLSYLKDDVYTVGDLERILNDIIKEFSSHLRNKNNDW